MKDFLELKHFEEFNNSKVHKSLKLTSKDDSKIPAEYMTQLKTRVIDFDDVKKFYLQKYEICEDNAKSVDALYKLDDRICMTEFKNGDFTSGEIVEKALSSAMMFMDITGCSLSEFRKKSLFVLVYNKDEKRVESRQLSAYYKSKQSRGRYSIFRLDHLWDFCFSEVKEIEKQEFDQSKYAKNIIAY
ncbi:hypothetical protein [Oribacterium sp. NK2B42]|uniref:hypothetical protein n=1 Tax=Oribacterium sp. NK2B42 TaxID=689781 RepID=UPI0004927906|nr:hypothetical protein [Oribacterium sp. NK2B42]